MHRAGKPYSIVDRVRRTSLGLLTTALVPAILAGCGAQYRPVVSAINPVGPAGQPTKYAIAVSNPNALLDAVTGYSIAGNVITVSVNPTNPFVAGQAVTLYGFAVSTFLNGVNLSVLSTGLTTTQFQASFTHANANAVESGTARLAGSLPGLVTYVDVSGDSVLSTPSIQANPSYFAINAGGGVGYTINTAGTLNDFGIFNPTGVLTSDIVQTTLPAASGPVSISAFAPAGGGQDIFIPETATSKIAVLNGGSQPSLLQEISVGANPVYVVGINGAPRVYAISQNNGGSGQVAALESTSASSLAISNTIPVGTLPVYGVMTADARRAFILNQGSASVSVINVTNNALDATTPTITIPQIAYTGGTTAPNPVWADTSALNTEVVVLNKGDGVHPGTLSLISIPLCNAQTLANNPNCNAGNPVDAIGFGAVVSTATVGVNPSMVSVLNDGTRAYVINQSSATGPCSIGASAGQGSVSVVSLLSGVVTATICGVASGTPTDAFVHGHPNSVIAVTGTPTGKVYVTSGDSTDLTIIYTDTDTVQTHITLQGVGLRVLASAQ